MRKIVCEACGSNKLTKENGFFKCMHCQTKYIAKEINEIAEVESNRPKAKNFSNYIDMSQNAWLEGDYQKAFNYSNKALEINPKAPDAWLAKMYSIEITNSNDIALDIIMCGENAIQFADNDEKEDIKDEVYGYFCIEALHLIRRATTQMSFVSFSEANHLSGELVSFAMTLKGAIPEDKIKNSSSIQEQIGSMVEECKNLFKATEKSIRSSGLTLAPVAFEGRRSIIDSFTNGLPEDKKQEVKSQWVKQGLCPSCSRKLSLIRRRCKICSS
ncbi:MAG: TFIIB-type zinc finger domain-containing protein [Defluviitaleaceae bacterium]|nr:TFIIB-type zinc finger domain-containing protein [Defluviitaleaceae bacterium]